MDSLFQVAAGIDVHRDTVVVSVRIRKRRRETIETKSFGTFRDELDAMCTWVREQDTQVVGMESRGVYFKPVWLALRRNVPERPVWLVNALAVKQVPGRKTDVNDSAWLSKLVMHGLVRPSFLPDVFGKTGRAIVTALAKGDMSPAQMADLAVGTLRSKHCDLVRALAGDMSSTKRWLLESLITQLSRTEMDIAQLDARISELLAVHQESLALLLQVPGIDRVAAACIIAEIGTDMSVFGSAKKLASWSGLAPNSHESAGKHHDVPTRKGNRWLRTMLVQVAHVGVRMKVSPWRSSFARLLRSTGSKMKAGFAIAHKVCVTIFHVLTDRQYRPYAPPPPTPAQRERVKRRALEQLQALGYQATRVPTMTSEASIESS